MIIISDVLDLYFKIRLKSEQYRKRIFKNALDRKLRETKLGRVLIRNINETMAQRPVLHEEFKTLVGNQNYQRVFWESDLGYFWLNGNFRNKYNPTFQLAIERINGNNYKSHLDIGCGWGELSFLVAKQTGAANIVGIDISEKLIEKAITLNGKNPKIKYLCKDVMDVNEKFDLLTVIGPSDYVHPDAFPGVLEKMLQIAGKEILLLNSLRAMPLDSVLKTTSPIEVRRYDVGYIQPLNFLLNNLQKKYSFSFTLEKHGLDALLARIVIH